MARCGIWGAWRTGPRWCAGWSNVCGGGGRELRLCYEAGPGGYGLHRQLTALGCHCVVVAPALIPRRPGDRVKTDRRDATALATLHRAGQPMPVWVPDATREVLRDRWSVRSGMGPRPHPTDQPRAGDSRPCADQGAPATGGVSCFVMGGPLPADPGPGRIGAGLPTCASTLPPSRSSCRTASAPVEDAAARVARLMRQIEELVPAWSLAAVVDALQARRGVSLLAAVTLVAEVGDFRRFANPRQLMAYLGLVPSESSSGGRARRGGITKAGNRPARRVLIEGAWTYRFAARLRRALHARNAAQPKEVRAIARDMVGFVWAIACRVQPQAAL
jgi:transposase